jgi:Tfp pilus assembly protein PilN
MNKYLSGVKNLLFFSPAHEFFASKEQLCVAIGMDSLSIAHGIRSFNRSRIKSGTTHRFQEKRYPSPETVAALTSQYIAEACPAESEIVLCLPKSWVVVVRTELPDVAGENLPEVIAHELDRITPFGPEDAFYDYQVVGKDKERLHVAIHAVGKKILTPYIGALADKGLTLVRIETNLAAVSAYLDHAWKEKDFVNIHVASGSYEGGFVRNGVLVAGFAGMFVGDETGRSFPAEIRDNVTTWIEELKRQKREPRLFLRCEDPALFARWEEQFPAPMHWLRKQDTSLSEVMEESEQEGASQDISMEATGGILSSLDWKSQALNLLTRGRRKEPSLPWMVTLILSLILLSMAAGAFFLPLYARHQHIAAIDAELSARKEEMKKIELLRKEHDALKDQLKTLGDFKQDRSDLLKILKELTVIIPKQVWLTRVHMGDAGVTVEGYATSAAEVLPRIEASTYFTKAAFASATTRDPRMNKDRFVIRMELEGIKKEESESKHGGKK